jgi:DNA invertase Pin-like site-specific DNA recombinase
MQPWWKRATAQAKIGDVLRAVAYYRHSAQDRQENSIPIQREQVCKWAAEHGVEIIKEFEDAGKSGLTAEHRHAFNDMMENWIKKRNDFQYVLVLDVSRWGRFQDTEVAAHYSLECTKHGKQVIYTTMGIPKKDDPLFSVYVTFERFRAAQYVGELSKKVFNGCVKIAQQGFRAGGTAPYALDRLLLNEARKPVQVLNKGERKSIQNQRVTLTAGNEKQVAIVRRIFQSFADGADESKIAESLNRDQVKSPRGVDWDAGKIRHVLQNETYTGTIVYNKTTQRLLSPSRPNPLDDWVRTERAFKGIISREIFDHAQQIFAKRRQILTRENMLARLREHYENYGFIKKTLIEADDNAPSLHAYQREFGGLDGAFLSAFQEVIDRVRQSVRDQIVSMSVPVEEWEDFIVLDKCLTVIIQPSIPVSNGDRVYWYFRTDQRSEIDITLGVPLSNSGRYDILGFLVLPRVLIHDRHVRLHGVNDSKVELFGHQSLDLLKEIMQ